MKDYTLSELRRINEAYMIVSEAQARANIFKNLTPEQAEALAKLSPSYKSSQIWGQTSNWICSTANRLIKYRNISFDDAYNLAKNAVQDITDYEKFAKRIKRNIDTIKSFDELSSVMDEIRMSGITQTGLSQSAKQDGRARQCYSLMKNGGEYFTITYEDGRWLIGYPNGFNYNSKFSSIGRWCHTGSFGDGEYYWGQYANSPVFYILDKQNGDVLCASYSHQEIRNQDDNWPEGGKNWNNFFSALGLKTPMVDNIENTIKGYVVPEDELTPEDVWERIDFNLVNEELFASCGNLDLSNDDYGRGGGDFNFILPLEKLSSDYPNDDSLYTRYSADVDTSKYYTFEEFVELVKLLDDYNNNESVIFYILRNIKCFSELWNTATDMPSLSIPNMIVRDNLTMSQRMSIDDLYRLYRGEDIRFGFDSRRKQKDIRKQLNYLVENFKKTFRNNIMYPLPDKYGYVRFGTDRYNPNGLISIDIDADQAENLATQVRDGEISFGDNQNIDILTLELDGKETFAAERVDEEKLYYLIYNCIQYIKWICKTPKDLDGQIRFDFTTNYKDEPIVNYYDGEQRLYNYPNSTESNIR